MNLDKKSGDNISAANAAWSFSTEQVVSSFDSHVKKSVPLYEEGQNLLVRMSDFFVDFESIYILIF